MVIHLNLKNREEKIRSYKKRKTGMYYDNEQFNKCTYKLSIPKNTPL